MMLAAPLGDFRAELQRIQLLPAPFESRPATNGHAEQTLEADLADLRAALRKAGHSTEQRRDLLERYSAEREKLNQFRQRLGTWEELNRFGADHDSQPGTPPPRMDHVVVLEELPEEFRHYFRGSVAWALDDTNTARQAWETVLNLPEADRRFRSTWAAFMLGRSLEGDDPEKAMEYYQRVRALAADGFSDRLGLAAASYGREALLNLRANRFEPAFNLYLEQLASGDDSAVNSLRFAAASALKTEDSVILEQLAANPKAQRVISAFLISRRWDYFGAQTPGVGEVMWLEAVEAVNVSDVEAAEVLALAAYQACEREIARRWIERARPTPTMKWLQAKLHLYHGKTKEAAELLAEVVRLLPTEPGDSDRPVQLEDNLSMNGFTYLGGEVRVQSQVLAEMGTIHLSRREFTQSLDALLRSGFWADAAYVAERVLTANELKAYVDRHWPEVANETSGETNEVEGCHWGEMDVRKELRYLLARRLGRLHRYAEARAYYPAEWLPQLDALTHTLAAGRDENRGGLERFEMLARAAEMTRTNGMELLGTEVEPDWHLHLGNFDLGSTVAERIENLTMLPPSEEEQKRTAEHSVIPSRRFHYRGLAAGLRVEAARIGQQMAMTMQDGSDDTARILCLSAAWLSESDPKAAYALYKEILKRCRKTEIGMEAARTGKIPRLDENGWMIPRNPTIDDVPRPGSKYIVHAGDTLFGIVRVLNAAGTAITVKDLMDANPGVIADKIRAGQKIFIPAPVELPPAEAQSEQAILTEVPQQEPTVGFRYVIHRGESFPAIAEAMITLGVPMTVDQLRRANPGVNPALLRIGQVIWIPAAVPVETGAPDESGGGTADN